jgi:hypothetical protein
MLRFNDTLKTTGEATLIDKKTNRTVAFITQPEPGVWEALYVHQTSDGVRLKRHETQEDAVDWCHALHGVEFDY